MDIRGGRMVKVPLGTGDWRRSVAGEADVPVLNRYFEQNPTNLEDQVALLSRPGLRRWLSVGNGPIRALYSQPGAFEDSLFVVSYDSLYSVEQDETITTLGSGLFTIPFDHTPSMAATGRLGSTPEHLFIADGRVLYLYVEDGYSDGTVSGTPANTDVVKIDTVYYKFTNASVDAGTPAGTVGNPWLVALGASATIAFENLAAAISDNGLAGSQYSTALTGHTTVVVVSNTANSVTVRAVTSGVAGDGISTTETGAALAWGAATLTGGGTAQVNQVQTPDDVGVVSVGHIAGYIIVVVAGDFDVNGRFYWITPGETTIDALNFATAERAPDPLISVRVVGDQFWLLGTSTTEVWYLSGDAAAPFQRVQARLFDRGVWEGTDVQINDTVIVVDPDGVVYAISGGGPQRISNHSIEQRIRESMIRQELTS